MQTQSTNTRNTGDETWDTGDEQTQTQNPSTETGDKTQGHEKTKYGHEHEGRGQREQQRKPMPTPTYGRERGPGNETQVAASPGAGRGTRDSTTQCERPLSTTRTSSAFQRGYWISKVRTLFFWFLAFPSSASCRRRLFSPVHIAPNLPSHLPGLRLLDFVVRSDPCSPSSTPAGLTPPPLARAHVSLCMQTQVRSPTADLFSCCRRSASFRTSRWLDAG